MLRCREGGVWGSNVRSILRRRASDSRVCFWGIRGVVSRGVVTGEGRGGGRTVGVGIDAGLGEISKFGETVTGYWAGQAEVMDFIYAGLGV